MEFFESRDRLAKSAGKELLAISMTPIEQEILHSVNPDQAVREGLDPFHGQHEQLSVEDEQAVELAIQALQLRVPEQGAWHWD